MRLRYRSLIIFASNAATRVMSILTAVVLVRLMSKEDFGTYRQVYLVLMFLAGIFAMQLPDSLYYFVPKLGAERRRLLTAQTLGISWVSAGVMGLIMYFSAEPLSRLFDGNPDLASLLRLFSPMPLAFLTLALVPAFMISMDRPARAGVYTLLREGVNAAVVITLVALDYPLSAALRAVVLVASGVALLAAVDMLRLSPGRLRRPDAGLLRSQLGYVLPLLMATLTGQIGRYLDKFLISSFFDTERFAVYSVGAIHVPFVALVTTSMFSAIMPDLVRLRQDGRTEPMLGLWRKAIRKCALVLHPAFAIMLVTAPDLMVLLYGRAYQAAAWPFMIYLLELPGRVAIYGALLRVSGRTRAVAVGALVGVSTNLVVSLALILISRAVFGPGSMLAFLSPSLGTLASFLTTVMYLLLTTRRVTGTSFRGIMPWGALGRILGLCVLAAAPAYVAPHLVLRLARMWAEVESLGPLVNIVISTAVFAVSAPLLILGTGTLEADEKEMLRLPLRLAGRLLRRIRT